MPVAGWPKSDAEVGCWVSLDCPNSDVDGFCCIVWGCVEGVVPVAVGWVLLPKVEPVGFVWPNTEGIVADDLRVGQREQHKIRPRNAPTERHFC